MVSIYSIIFLACPQKFPKSVSLLGKPIEHKEATKALENIVKKIIS
ncbi:hypothetical protein [Desulfothermus naphthae]